MSYTADDINRLIAAPREHERLEFKESKEQLDTSDLLRYCVALANEGGGKILLGVTNKAPRKVVGTNAYQNLGKIKTQILDKLHFHVEAEEVSHPDGRVLIFTIPSRPTGTAYNYEGAYLMRVGESLRTMPEDKLRRIFAEGGPGFLLRPAVEDVSADDVVRLLDCQSFFDLAQLPFPSTRDAVLQRFELEQLVINTLACVM